MRTILTVGLICLVVVFALLLIAVVIGRVVTALLPELLILAGLIFILRLLYPGRSRR